ncbi:hypothetical protein GV827_21670 [Sulfitobacter sp. JBTF-M27]|uniref:Uncharacterized protein n=1 Tax=Sulfitobacter sediminilitoris TaxID=2698830 RepID=A0A6P0CFK3_9RHOB|nr:hypothetical protein [Sulfitobacter sediminilitoris]NEK24981.1 hypothetical protein [Sulfitobacter sediminilitoris]
MDDIVKNAKNDHWDIDTFKLLLELETNPEQQAMAKIIVRADPYRTAALHRRIRTLRRCRREAEAHRRKALARLIAVSMGEMEPVAAA